MPAKSKAQLRYLNVAAARGEVPQKVANDFNKASKGLKLPEKLHTPKLKKYMSK